MLCAFVGVGSVRAQQAAGAAQSQKLFAAAQEAKRAGELPRALCLMERAQNAWPNHAFSFNVAQLQRELGLCSEALANYQAFLNSEREPTRREQAERAVAELKHCTPRSAPAAAAESCNTWTAAALAGLHPPPNSLRPNAGKATDPKHEPIQAASSGEAPSPAPTDRAQAGSAPARAADGGASPKASVHGADPRAASSGKAPSPAPGVQDGLQGEAASTASSGLSSPGAGVPERAGHGTARAADGGVAVGGGAAALAPAEVARAQVGAEAPPLAAAERPGAGRGVPRYLPWIFGAVGVVCVGLAGYELAQVISTQRELDQLDRFGPMYKDLQSEGTSAQKMFWVFTGAGALTLGAALVLVLVNSDEPPPPAAAR